MAGPARPAGGPAPRQAPPARPGGPPRPAPAPRPIPPDARPTAVIPTVTEDTAPTSRPHRRGQGRTRRNAPTEAAAGRTARRQAPAGAAAGPQARAINWKWVRRGLIIGVVAIVVLPIVTFAMAYLIVDVPQPGDIRTNQVSTILASDGTTELAKIVPPEGNRVDINIDQVPQHVRDAVMAAEDRDFYSNPGFSFSGFARAVKNNLFGGDTQGGSTITQQYVKNALGGLSASRHRRRRAKSQGIGHRNEDVQ